MTFETIEFGSDDFRKECDLRQQVLRAPIGLSLDDEDLAAEKDERHFGLFDGVRNLVACAIAVELSPTEAKIRQMAVSATWRKLGCGRRLMLGIEDQLVAGGHIHIRLHARLSAAGFYQKLGYRRTGGEFLEVGIPHVRMEKQLVP